VANSSRREIASLPLVARNDIGQVYETSLA
jgi:hypothetical protein